MAAFFLSKVILSGKEYSADQLNAMSPEALNNYLLSEARSVQAPYLVIAGTLLVVALIFRLAHFPKVQEEHGSGLSLNSACSAT